MKFTQPATFSPNIKVDVLAVCVSADDPTGVPPDLDEAFGGALSTALTVTFAAPARKSAPPG